MNGGQASIAYPIYDAHWNMISTLTKVDGGGYSYAPLRTYDAWGLVRSGATTGDPKGRYCANLGHKWDDESGLIYMRARYYEPSSGRFISEDPGVNGGNWYSYCSNLPTAKADMTGTEGVDVFGGPAGLLLTAFYALSVESGFLKHCYKVGEWGYDNPSKADVGKIALALVIEASVVGLTAIAAAAVTAGVILALPTAGISLVAVVVAIAFVATLTCVAEMTCDALDEYAMEGEGN